MEFTSIVVHLVFSVVHMLCLSFLPLGRRLLSLYWTDGLMGRLFLLANVINVSLAWACAHFWGLTTLIVLETLGNGFVLFRVAKGNAALERGLRILTTESKVEVQVED